ncbi:10110_t:CDS:2 [Scutellospora calospora]|uniref:10110_t:CDS:1 n=1 Tax=Scutellospora calospora TaxID=85575 RepID=A0ACA9JUJ6_9GLOM|nr:10110_t:CDS:2 [Scutellospora calospora]
MRLSSYNMLQIPTACIDGRNNDTIFIFGGIPYNKSFVNQIGTTEPLDSYAPYSFEEEHSLENITRQAKFSKDNWNYELKYIQNYDVPKVKDTWILVKSIELPLQKRNNNFVIQQVCDLCEALLFINSLFLENITKIDLIEQLIPPETPAIPRRTRRPSIPKIREISGVKRGDVIICNWTSYVEVLYLAFRFDPIFTQIYPSTNTLRPISLWTALKLAGSYPEVAPPSSVKTYSLQELVNDATINNWGPIIIFPEGTTSNGRALLKFVPIFKGLSLPIKDFSIHVLSIRYEYENFSPTYTVGNKFWHFIRLCSQYYNVLHIKILAPEESLSSPNFAVPAARSSVLPSPSITQDDVVGSHILNLMGQLGRMRKTNLGMEDKKAFLDFYWERTSGYAKKKK